MNWIVKQLMAFTGTQRFLSAQLDITSACNLKCRHCYQNRDDARKQLTFDDWCAILDQYTGLLNKLHLMPNFGISGGEPTISPLFTQILAELGERWPGAGINILTNGTKLTPEIVSVIAKMPSSVQVSIDGPDAVRHDMVRGEGAFEDAMAGIRALRAAGVRVRIQAVLSERTAPWIPEFFRLAADAGVSSMNFTRFIPQGRGVQFQREGSDSVLLPAGLRSAYGEILRCSREFKVPSRTTLPLFALISPELGANGKAGFQGLIVDCYGNLKVTSRADFVLGNILEQGLEELFLRHPLMKSLRAGDIEVCGKCNFFDRCGGDRTAAYAAYGSFLKKDPGCWVPGDLL
jgi:radical SAM protein with 4Fe4S-binding SPASM domain